MRQVDDVGNALAFARQHGLRVSIAGVRHRMGGHAFAPNALVLETRGFNRIIFDEQAAVVRVESGASWHDIQKAIHPKWAVKSMPSTDIFTVGGSISVNAHGMDHRSGSVGRTVRSMRVMLPDGTVRNISRTADARLFNLVVGGYGLFGVTLDVELEIVPNAVYESGREVLDYQQFVPMLASRIVSDPGIGLMYAHLLTAPQSLLRETIVYTYKEVPSAGAIVPPLGEVGQVKLRRQVVDLCLRANGRFFLPYQVAYTRAQLERSYPQIREFLAARAEFDPNRVLTSTFVEKIEALLGQ